MDGDAKRVEVFYGMHLTVDPASLREMASVMDAERKVDIAVKIGDETREFTFEQFAYALGFEVKV